MSELEREFADLWVELYPTIDLHHEHQFIPPRRFRFDFAHLPTKTAIELQGGIWVKSGHNTGTGLLRDYKKLNLATSMGWRVFMLAREMVNDEWLGSIAVAIQQSELTAIPELEEIAVNCQPNHRSRQRDYIGCITPKTIKGIIYQYWTWYERGERCYKCLGSDRASAVAKAKAIYDPRQSSLSR